MPKDTEHWGARTLRHQDTSALVTSAEVSGHFGTGAEVSRTFRHRSQRYSHDSHACQRRQLRSGQGGELKAVDVCGNFVPLSLNCGF